MRVGFLSYYFDDTVDFYEHAQEHGLNGEIVVFDNFDHFKINCSKENFDVLIFDPDRLEEYDLLPIKLSAEANTKCRYIILSAYADDFDSDVQLRFGIEKVFSKDESLKKLIDYLNANPEKDCVVQSDRTYVSMAELRERDYSPVNLSIEVKGQDVVLFKMGVKLDQNRINQYIEKGLKQTYYLHKGELWDECKLLKPFPIRLCLDKERKCLFDFFIKVDGEFQQLTKKGSPFGSSHIEILKSHRINKIHIQNEDLLAMGSHISENYKAIVQDSKLPIADKGYALKYLLTKQINPIYKKPSENNILKINRLYGPLEFILTNEPKNLRGILASPLRVGFRNHSINVSALTFALVIECAKMRNIAEFKLKTDFYENVIFSSDTSKEILFIAGIVHEIGRLGRYLYEFSPHFKSLIELAENEKLEDLCHAQIGHKLLSNYSEINPKTLEIVSQHLEFNDGSGIPRQLRNNRLSLYVQVTILSNFYEEMISVKRFGPQEALAHCRQNGGKFNKYVLDALERVVEHYLTD